jgi:hypothetical protein
MRAESQSTTPGVYAPRERAFLLWTHETGESRKGRKSLTVGRGTEEGNT